MILPVQSKINSASNRTQGFGKLDKEELKNHPILIENTFANNISMKWDEFTNAMTLYSAKGLLGSVNSNFYEYLTMGRIPALIGGLMFISVFNSANKHFNNPADRFNASQFGRKMALGVIFYALAKNISQSFITKPVKWVTGVDVNEPYAELKFRLPEFKNDTDLTSLEYHRVLESIEFPRWELKYGKTDKNENVNEWFDKIAKKNGLGTSLKDSDQEVKPKVKEFVAKTSFAKTFSSYLWAATGVGVALQESWNEFFNIATPKFGKTKRFVKSMKILPEVLWNSMRDFYNGKSCTNNSVLKHSGKFLLGASVLSSVVGFANVVLSNKKPSGLEASDVIDSNRKCVVN